MTKRTHAWLFQVGEQIFSVSDHNKGRRQVKVSYVDNFLDAMINLGWYED